MIGSCMSWPEFKAEIDRQLVESKIPVNTRIGWINVLFPDTDKDGATFVARLAGGKGKDAWLEIACRP